jgi:hypothetical protein
MRDIVILVWGTSWPRNVSLTYTQVPRIPELGNGDVGIGPGEIDPPRPGALVPGRGWVPMLTVAGRNNVKLNCYYLLLALKY